MSKVCLCQSARPARQISELAQENEGMPALEMSVQLTESENGVTFLEETPDVRHLSFGNDDDLGDFRKLGERQSDVENECEDGHGEVDVLD